MGKIPNDGAGYSFKYVDVINIYHDACIRLMINVNIGEELDHESNTYGDNTELVLKVINIVSICITGAGSLHLNIIRGNIRAQRFGKKICI